ncbi:MAG: SUMF1/EgtB/PvdO family nonheme iron enzyme [Candidatus Hydrogenedentes bacterium]|nr:SUMF1/EgtB/PvdO family nonheme iron enzyme [Candidatus Hydrogenedentota bacterium]
MGTRTGCGAFLWGMAVALTPWISHSEDPAPFANSLGMPFVQVPKGTFAMGSQYGDWDEMPVHRVTISKPFLMSSAKVTLEQFQAFRPEHTRAAASGAVTGLSWYDAVAFCEWLSQKEGKPYRLPTEAEWEHACRLNGGGHGDGTSPDRPAPGALGITGMCDEVPEWCQDWFGEYPLEPQTDPVGPDGGMARLVRGNKLDADTRYMMPHTRGHFYQRSANRAGMAPGFAHQGGPTEFGAHGIGFRVVQTPLPETKPYPRALPMVSMGIKQDTAASARETGPAADKPYFRKRYLLPSPPESVGAFHAQSKGETITQHISAMQTLNLHPSFCGHNHSPAVEVMPNGDLLMVIFTSWEEYEPGMSLMATRLRLGADAWDMPSYFIDMPDACDNTPLLWTEGNRVYLFFSSTQAIGGYPFNCIESDDSGATWSEVKFPKFTTEVGGHSRQPINTVVRDRDGILYVPSDALGAASVLWVSRDNMQTWADPAARTGGRHTTFVLLKDQKTILGMGGKSSDINGYMPKSISDDEGKTWTVTQTQFPAYGSNQRPCVLRLKSGRLFFCGDFQRIDGAFPPDIQQRGSYAALSDDDGETWRVKKLWGTQPHEFPKNLGGADTIGYSVARQSPDGTIHLITTMNLPCLHLAMNEAWILSDDAAPGDGMALMANSATSIRDVKRYEERYPNGKRRMAWHAGIGNDGRYLLHGKETWFYPDGRRQYESSYELGQRSDSETLYRNDGSKVWRWEHGKDGVSLWTHWWPNGERQAQSEWKEFHAQGPALRWDMKGKLMSEVAFEAGVPKLTSTP